MKDGMIDPRKGDLDYIFGSRQDAVQNDDKDDWVILFWAVGYTMTVFSYGVLMGYCIRAS